MEPVRILMVVPNMHAAGLETLIMNIYRNIDRTQFQFDFLVHYRDHFFYDDEIEKLGGAIYRFSLRDDGRLIKYLKNLNVFFKNHQYSVVHGHMVSTACFYLAMAQRYKVPVRIIHSHNTSNEKTGKGWVKQQLSRLSILFANYYFACGKMAGEFLFKHRKFSIIHNAIDLDAFSPDDRLRDKMRRDMQLQDHFVIGHIGRFTTQKNHAFLLRVLKKVVERLPETTLILVGEGELEKKIRKTTQEMNLHQHVRFLGVRSDINAIYNMIDVFTLPSFFEGLPVVGIECQACGRMVLVSDEVTREIQLTDLVEFLPIDGSDAENIWADRLLLYHMHRKKIPSEVLRRQLISGGYEIKEEAKRLVEQYRHLISENCKE